MLIQQHGQLWISVCRACCAADTDHVIVLLPAHAALEATQAPRLRPHSTLLPRPRGPPMRGTRSFRTERQP